MQVQTIAVLEYYFVPIYAYIYIYIARTCSRRLVTFATRRTTSHSGEPHSNKLSHSGPFEYMQCIKLPLNEGHWF